MQSNNGFALAVVLLVSLVALLAAVGAASLTTITARQTATAERRATSALLAAESGLNTLVVRSRTDEYELVDSDASVQAWLDRVGLDRYHLPDGSVINLAALNETADTVTIRSEGIAPGGSRRVVLQEYELATGIPDLGLFANAALVTQGSLSSKSAVSTIIGRASDVGSWIFPGRDAGDALLDEYFTTSGPCEGSLDEVTYKVTSEPDDDGNMSVERVEPDGCSVAAPEAIHMNQPGTLVPFAVAQDVDVSLMSGNSEQTFAVTDTTVYAEGNTIFIGEDGKAVIDEIDGNEVTVTWTTVPSELDPAGTITEATPIRVEVPSAIAETSCPSGPHTADKLPQGCYLQDLSNIWEKTFPETDKGEMLQLAEENLAHYGPDEASEWPTGEVSGVTWIDGAQTGNFNGKGGPKADETSKGLCGEGVVILNTGVYDSNSPSESINLNVSDCEFNGVLYVIGELGIQGNLDSFSGTIIVETDQGTKVQGNGEKALYDPIAIRKALANLPPPTVATGFLGEISSTWRFGE